MAHRFSLECWAPPLFTVPAMMALLASTMFVWMQMVRVLLFPVCIVDLYRLMSHTDNEVGTSGKTFNPEFPVGGPP